MIDKLDIPPICKIEGCENPAQVYSSKSMNSNGKNQYLKFCRRHTYRDIKPKYNDKGEK
jgi:hypothetical protein